MKYPLWRRSDSPCLELGEQAILWPLASGSTGEFEYSRVKRVTLYWPMRCRLQFDDGTVLTISNNGNAPGGNHVEGPGGARFNDVVRTLHGQLEPYADQILFEERSPLALGAMVLIAGIAIGTAFAAYNQNEDVILALAAAGAGIVVGIIVWRFGRVRRYTPADPPERYIRRQP